MAIWTDDEVALLIKIYRDTDKSKLEKVFGRGINSISKKAHTLGLYKHWLEHETRLLQEMYPNTNAKVIAKRLDRTVQSVKDKAFSIGLRQYRTQYTVPVGTIRERGPKRTCGNRYLYIKCNDGSWKTLTQHIWTTAGRDIPAGSRIVQVKGDVMNPSLDDLMCMDLTEQAFLCINGYTPEEARVCGLISKIKKTIKEKK